MKIGIATLYYQSLPVSNAVLMLSRNTDHIMISPIYKTITEKDLKELIEIKESFGIEYYVHGLFPNRGSNPRIHGYKLKLLKESIENSYKLESDILVIHPSRRKGYKKELSILKEAYKIAKDHGITLAIENKADDESFLKYEKDFEKLIEDLPDIRFCLDTAHFFIWNGDSRKLSSLIEKFKDRIVIFHIADARVGEDLQMVPGYGDINWYFVGKALTKFDLKKIPLILETIYPTNVLEGIKNLRHVIIENFKL